MLAYDRSGTGVPLVLVHAFPLSRSMWSSAKEKLNKNFDVITIDLPGFGESALGKDLVPMADMANEIIETLDSIGVKEKFVLAGVSMGGYVMFQIQKQFSERIRGLVFISTKATPDTEEIRERRKKTIDLVKEQGVSVLAEKMIPSLLGKTSLESRPDVVANVKDMILKANPEAVCAALRGMAIRPDSSRFLQNINVPTLILSGEEDTFVVPTEMSQMARLIPRARFESIPQAGHLLPLEQPDLFFESFSNYLKRSVL